MADHMGLRRACCIIEDGARCPNDATGNPYGTLNKRLTRLVWARHKVELDDKGGHTDICDMHRGLIVSLKKELDSKRKKPQASTEGVETITVDFSSLHASTLKRYRKKFSLSNGENMTKAELLASIEKHFNTLPVNEGKDIISFLKFVQKTKIQRQDYNSSTMQ